MDANDQVASDNRRFFETSGIVTVNVMASPGAGKTSLILRTIDALNMPVAVIEGDIASTFDAEKVAEKKVPVVQINTGGACHLDASQIKNALGELNLKTVKYLFIENVGNLVCPAEFRLGERAKIVVSSVPEGDDKPYKYPLMFSAVDAVILNKMDIMPYIDFDIKRFRKGVQGINRKVPIFEISCKTGEGLDRWVDWLKGLAV